MATTMKKTTSKPASVEVESEIKTKEYAPHDLITCRSVTAGGLHVTCKSGNWYEFIGCGETCDIEYQDLVALIRKRSEHIFNPRFIIEDDEFLEEFQQIRQLYEGIYSVKDLKQILNLPVETMVDEIKKLPTSVQESVKTLAATEISNGNLDSIKKVKALEDFFGSDFTFLSKLFN